MRKKIIIHLRGSEFNGLYNNMSFPIKNITKKLFSKVVCGIVLGNTVRHVFHDLIKGENIYVIPNGIKYTEYDDIAVEKKDTNITRILFLSNLRKRKGILLFLEAIVIVLRTNINIEIIVAGEWDDYDVKNAAEKILQGNNVKEKIKFIGNVSGKEKIILFKSSDMFVFPPIEPEGMPWVILEAMSAGVPIVSTDQGTILEVIEDGVSGFIVDSNPESLAEKIRFLIENPEIGKEIGMNGRRRVEDEFSEAIYFKKLEKVFEMTAGSK